jgi:hypothetical protein
MRSTGPVNATHTTMWRNENQKIHVIELGGLVGDEGLCP